CEVQQFATIADTDLAEDAGKLMSHRDFAARELLCQPLSTLTGSDRSNDIEFARGQPEEVLALVLSVVTEAVVERTNDERNTLALHPVLTRLYSPDALQKKVGRGSLKGDAA